MTRLELACRCGGVMKVRFSPPDVDRERELIELWKSIHMTPDCAPTTPRKAGRARNAPRPGRLDNLK